MERIKVTSSNVKAIGYDAATETLEVEFVPSGIYQYAGVKPAEHEALMQAGSIGGHFARHFKGRNFTKVGEG